jgi:hypothetical protein
VISQSKSKMMTSWISYMRKCKMKLYLRLIRSFRYQIGTLISGIKKALISDAKKKSAAKLSMVYLSWNLIKLGSTVS